jgi:hypothetical protein
MSVQKPESIRKLEQLAERDPDCLASVADLVRDGLMRLKDIDDLRSAGLHFYRIDDGHEGGRVWVPIAEFLKASRIVGEARSQDAIAKSLGGAACSDTVH